MGDSVRPADMIDTFERTPTLGPARRISWGGVFAGVAVALAVQLSFGILGLGIGASALHPSGAASAQSFGIGSAAWLLATTLLALFAGGWVAGRLAGVPRALDSALHGVIAWAITTILAVYLVTTAIGGIFSGAGALLGNVVGAAGGGIASAAPGLANAAGSQLAKNGITADALTQQIQGLLAQPAAKHAVGEAKLAAGRTASDPRSLHENYNDLLYRFAHDSGTTSAAADRRKLIAIVAERQGVSTAEATKTVDAWQTEAQSAARQARSLAQGAADATRNAGDAAASGIATTGIITFAFLLLGAVAAAFGGFTSAPRTRLGVR